MKIAIILAFATYACANDIYRTDYVASYEKVERVFKEVMIVAENAGNNDVDMFFSMIVHSLLHLGKDYYSSPKEYDTVYLPISVDAMNEVRVNVKAYIQKLQSLYGNVQNKYVSLIYNLIEKLCKPEEMEVCDNRIHDYIAKSINPLKEKYMTAVSILFHLSDFAAILTEGKNSVRVLSHKKYPLVRFLTNPQKSKPAVEVVSTVYALVHGPISVKAM